MDEESIRFQCGEIARPEPGVLSIRARDAEGQWRKLRKAAQLGLPVPEPLSCESDRILLRVKPGTLVANRLDRAQICQVGAAVRALAERGVFGVGAPILFPGPLFAGWRDANFSSGTLRDTAGRLLFELEPHTSLTDRLRLARACGINQAGLEDLASNWTGFRRIEPALVEEVPGGEARPGYDLPAALEAFDHARPWKSSGHRHLYKFGSRSARVFDYRGPGALRRLAGDEGRRLWKNALALESLGVEVVPFHAWVRRNGLSIVLGDWLPDAVTLNEYSRAARPGLAARVGSYVRRLHDHLGLYHPDLTAVNILVREREGRPRFLLIDFGEIVFGSAPSMEQRIFNLGQLNASLPHPVSMTDRLRFYRSYAWGRKDWSAQRRELFSQILEITMRRHRGWPAGFIPSPTETTPVPE